MYNVDVSTKSVLSAQCRTPAKRVVYMYTYYTTTTW